MFAQPEDLQRQQTADREQVTPKRATRVRRTADLDAPLLDDVELTAPLDLVAARQTRIQRRTDGNDTFVAREQGDDVVRRSPAPLVASTVTPRIQREDDDDLDDTTKADEVVDDRSYMRRGWDAAVSIVTWSPWVTPTKPATKEDTATSEVDTPKQDPPQRADDKPTAEKTGEATPTTGKQGGKKGKGGTTQPAAKETAVKQPNPKQPNPKQPNPKQTGKKTTPPVTQPPTKARRGPAEASTIVDQSPTVIHTGGGAESPKVIQQPVETASKEATPKEATPKEVTPKEVTPKPKALSLEQQCRADFDVLKPKAKEALDAATARNLPVKTVRSKINLLNQGLDSSKTQWKTFATELKAAATATEELRELIAQTDEKNAGAYAKAKETLTPSLTAAMLAAKEYKLDTTTLAAEVEKLEQLEKVQPQLYLEVTAQLKPVRMALQAVQAELKEAKECAELAAAVLPEATAALKDAAAALDGDPVHPRDSDYWKHLRSADELVREKKLEYEAETKKPHPNWREAAYLLRLVRVRTTRIGREIAVAPARPDNRVGTNTTSAAIDLQNPTAIKGDQHADEQASLTEALDALDGVGAWRGGGGKWGTPYGDNEGRLPLGSYKEYYVRPPAGEKSWGKRRLVREQRGRIYYTWTHYGETGEPEFVLLRS